MPFAPFGNQVLRRFGLPVLKCLFVAMAEQFGDLFFETLQSVSGGEVERGFIELGELTPEYVVDHIVLQHVGIGLIEDAESWIETGLGGVRAKQRCAEGVDCADACRVDFAKVAEPKLLRLGGLGLLQTVIAGVADARAHLAGGCVGKRDRDQLAEPGWLGVGVAARVEMGKESFGEDKRFAAAGAGGEGDRMFTAVERGALFGG